MYTEMNIGERIAYFRSSKGLTVNKLANLSGISQSYLRDIEEIFQLTPAQREYLRTFLKSFRT